jgi:hypothetical protein
LFEIVKHSGSLKSAVLLHTILILGRRDAMSIQEIEQEATGIKIKSGFNMLILTLLLIFCVNQTPWIVAGEFYTLGLLIPLLILCYAEYIYRNVAQFNMLMSLKKNALKEDEDNRKRLEYEKILNEIAPLEEELNKYWFVFFDDATNEYIGDLPSDVEPAKGFPLENLSTELKVIEAVSIPGEPEILSGLILYMDDRADLSKLRCAATAMGTLACGRPYAEKGYKEFWEILKAKPGASWYCIAP